MSTARMYTTLPDLPATKAGPNGFEEALATFVVDFLAKPDIAPLWDQGCWRAPVWVDVDHPEGTLDRTMADTALSLFGTSAAPACGTAGCLAGWLGELSGVDWVLDRRDLADRRAATAHSPYLAYILLSRAALASLLGTVVGSWVWHESLAHVEVYGWDDMKTLGARGFDPVTHVIVPVGTWAGLRLGITGLDANSDWVDDPYALFSGNNDEKDVRRTIEEYATEWPGLRAPSLRGPAHGLVVMDEVFEVSFEGASHV